MGGNNNGIPDDILRELISDPDFQKLNEKQQDEALTRFSQESYGNIEPAEGLLMRTIKAISPQQMGYEIMGGTGPGDLGMALSGQPGLNSAATAEGIRTKAVNNLIPPETSSTNENPFFRGVENTVRSIPNMTLNAVTDPQIIGSLLTGIGKSNLGKNVGRMASADRALEFSNKLEGMNETSGSGLSKQMGKAMSDLQATKPDNKISFLDEMTRPQMDSKVTKLINKTDNLHLYDLGNLSLGDSQQVVADLKANLRQSLRTGDIVKSDERGILGFLDELKAKQLRAFPEHARILGQYGEGIDAYKEVAGDIPQMLEGKGNRIDRAAREQALKKSAPEAFKKYQSYKNTKRIMKAGAGITGAAGGLGWLKKHGVF